MGGFIQDPDELENQIQELNNYLTDKMEMGGLESSNATKDTTHSGPDLSVFRQVFIGAEENAKRDALCSACQVYIGVLMYQVVNH